MAYTLRSSPRARSVSLMIRPDTGLVVTAPIGYPQGRLEWFLRRHERWISAQLERIAAIAARIPKRWPYGDTLLYRGDAHRVVVEEAGEMPGVVRTPQRTLLVRIRRPGLEGARRLLKRWFVQEAQRWLGERTAALGRALGIEWRRIRIRDARSRWGSCSAHGCLTFNYRLVMAPDPVMEYVVLHELMHRRELNHSAQFWSLVSAQCPAYRASIAWLKTDGLYLSL